MSLSLCMCTCNEKSQSCSEGKKVLLLRYENIEKQFASPTEMQSYDMLSSCACMYLYTS